MSATWRKLRNTKSSLRAAKARTAEALNQAITAALKTRTAAIAAS